MGLQPEKAIVRETDVVKQVFGDTLTVKRPEILIEWCIGCGICEHKYPVEGGVAIRVHFTSEV
jgi:Pyruvate/2-oxoacid:ferredoxin oxidoreductase delta subunit